MNGKVDNHSMRVLFPNLSYDLYKDMVTDPEREHFSFGCIATNGSDGSSLKQCENFFLNYLCWEEEFLDSCRSNFHLFLYLSIFSYYI